MPIRVSPLNLLDGKISATSDGQRLKSGTHYHDNQHIRTHLQDLCTRVITLYPIFRVPVVAAPNPNQRTEMPSLRNKCALLWVQHEHTRQIFDGLLRTVGMRCVSLVDELLPAEERASQERFERFVTTCLSDPSTTPHVAIVDFTFAENAPDVLSNKGLRQLPLVVCAQPQQWMVYPKRDMFAPLFKPLQHSKILPLLDSLLTVRLSAEVINHLNFVLMLCALC